MTLTHTEIEYTTDLIEDRRLCDREPHVLVQLSRREVTTAREPDGSTTTNEQPWVVVATWAYHHPTKQGA